MQLLTTVPEDEDIFEDVDQERLSQDIIEMMDTLQSDYKQFLEEYKDAQTPIYQLDLIHELMIVKAEKLIIMLMIIRLQESSKIAPFDLRLRLTGNSGLICRFACGGCTEAGQSLISCGGSCAFQGCATMEPYGRNAKVKEPTLVISDDDNDDSDVSGVLPRRRRRSPHECGSRPL